MLCASRLSEMHTLGVQGLPAEPAAGGVAAGPPAPGLAPGPEVHDAASATTPNVMTQIRLTTADLPASATTSHGTKPKPPLRRLGRPAPPDHRQPATGERPYREVPATPPADYAGWPAPPAVLLSTTPAGPSTSPYGRRAVRLRDTRGRGAGAVTLGSFLRSFTRGNVWLAEVLTGHSGYEKHDRPGGGREGNRGTTLTPARPAHTPSASSSDKPLPSPAPPYGPPPRPPGPSRQSPHQRKPGVTLDNNSKEDSICTPAAARCWRR